MMPPPGVDFQEIDAQPVEERTEQARRGNRDPQLGVGRTIEELLADIEAGRKYMKTYKQMKMYNDPALNPVLYGKK